MVTLFAFALGFVAGILVYRNNAAKAKAASDLLVQKYEAQIAELTKKQ